MSDRGARQRGAGDGLADLADVRDESRGLSSVASLGSNAGGRETVEVLAADGETGDTAGELITVLLDGTLQGGDLVVDAFLASRRPDSEEEGCVCGDGSGDGRDGVVGSSALLLFVSMCSQRQEWLFVCNLQS